jgi:membrane fusion protein (multidrug efflux system)
MKINVSYASVLNAVKLSTYVRYLSIFTFTILLASCSDQKLKVSAPSSPSLPVIQVNQSNETTYLEYPATIQGAVDVELRPQVGGYLDKILVNEGQVVKAGQPLFKINELPFREALNNAKASLRAAEAAASNAKLEVDKLQPLVQNKVVSDVQLQSAKIAYALAGANVDQSKAGVAAAQINLSYTTIKAPVSGRIGRLPKKQGSLVSPADPSPLTQLSDAHEVHVYFSLAESDFIDFNQKYPAAASGKLNEIPPVSLILANNAVYEQEGRIDMLDGQFDKTTGAITLRASFANPSGHLRSGNTGKIRLSLAHDAAILIPQSATIEIQDKVFVYTVDTGNKVAKQPVTVLGISGANYLIKDGLKTGDRIISKGFENLKDGDAIVPEAIKANSLKVAAN